MNILKKIFHIVKKLMRISSSKKDFDQKINNNLKSYLGPQGSSGLVGSTGSSASHHKISDSDKKEKCVCLIEVPWTPIFKKEEVYYFIDNSKLDDVPRYMVFRPEDKSYLDAVVLSRKQFFKHFITMREYNLQKLLEGDKYSI